MTAIAFLALIVLQIAGSGEPVHGAEGSSVSGEHYVLHWQGTQDEAQEMSRVLEAAWPQYKAFFMGTPRLAKGEKLTVRFLANRESWAAAIQADGTQAPSGAGGYYWPGSKTAYLFRQPTRYYTRCLLLHEAAHQFHYLSSTGNQNPKALWYTEGVAEYLGWHSWDGVHLVLGFVPMSLKNYAGIALKSLSAGDMDLRRLVDGGDHRAMGCMLVRYLLHGEKGRLRTRFARLAMALNRGKKSLKCFKAQLGPPARLQTRFLAWLKDAQEPWRPVFNEWERTGPDSFAGIAKGVVSCCRLRQAGVKLSATLCIPEKKPWIAGLLLHLEKGKNYTVLLATHTGRIVVQRIEKGKWVTMTDVKCPDTKTKGQLRFRAVRESGKVTAYVEDALIGTYELPGSVLGLSLRDCSVRFRDVTWETK